MQSYLSPASFLGARLLAADDIELPRTESTGAQVCFQRVGNVLTFLGSAQPMLCSLPGASAAGGRRGTFSLTH